MSQDYTKHCERRAKERTNIGREASLNFVTEAIREGKIKEELPKEERQFLAKRERENSYFIYFQGYLFVMNDSGCCITMYQAPEWFNKAGHHNGKESIRNPKKYMRCHKNEDARIWY